MKNVAAGTGTVEQTVEWQWPLERVVTLQQLLLTTKWTLTWAPHPLKELVKVQVAAQNTF